MSIQSVQSRGLEQLPAPARVAGDGSSAQPREAAESQRSGQPQDQVIVSEEARKMATAASGDGKGGGKGEVELQLDFRKLRELVSGPSKSPSHGG